jgi:hypothetical protein
MASEAAGRAAFLRDYELVAPHYPTEAGEAILANLDQLAPMHQAWHARYAALTGGEASPVASLASQGSATLDGRRMVWVAGPGAAGKSTIWQQVYAGASGLVAVVKTTTRPPRPYERDGEHYYFVDDAEFERRCGEGAFVATYSVADRGRFGLERSAIRRAFAASDCVTLEAFPQFFAAFTRDADVSHGVSSRLFYVLPPQPGFCHLAFRFFTRQLEMGMLRPSSDLAREIRGTLGPVQLDGLAEARELRSQGLAVSLLENDTPGVVARTIIRAAGLPARAAVATPN